jgi:hypothetical protein
VTTAIIAAAASILVATIGAFAAYLMNIRLERHRNQLARVNQQLSKLYGPLHAMTRSNGIAYRAMCDRYDPAGLFDQRTAESLAQLTKDQRNIYRLWMTTVLQPTNRAARDVMLNNTDLLIDGIMPGSALKWFTHVAGYESILTMWENGDDSQIFSLVPYPQTFTDYVAQSFQTLQEQQRRLLARVASKTITAD